MKKWGGADMDIFKELQEEGVDAALLEEIQRFRQAHPAPQEAAERVPQPRYLYLSLIHI